MPFAVSMIASYGENDFTVIVSTGTPACAAASAIRPSRSAPTWSMRDS